MKPSKTDARAARKHVGKVAKYLNTQDYQGFYDRCLTKALKERTTPEYWEAVFEWGRETLGVVEWRSYPEFLTGGSVALIEFREKDMGAWRVGAVLPIRRENLVWRIEVGRDVLVKAKSEEAKKIIRTLDTA